ncbi:MAG: rhomboid family intramembrane serine protease [Methyloligellaceae bacterium]
MFVPIHDKNPLKSIPFQYATVGLIALNVVIYLLFGTTLVFTAQENLVDFTLIPAEFLAGVTSPSSSLPRLDAPLHMPERFTILSYMFIHGSAFHLLGNMLFLWVFGDNVEDAMGHLRFLMFYLMCGIFAGLTHSLIMAGSDIPVIGASGSVAGIVAAYLMLHPKVKVWVLALWRIPLRIPAAWALGFWSLLQLFSAVSSPGEGIAWWAHVGGLAAGAVLILFMRRPGVALFDQTPGGA